jgi:hypothetical protein
MRCVHTVVLPQDSDIFYQLYEQDSSKSQGIAG